MTSLPGQPCSQNFLTTTIYIYFSRSQSSPPVLCRQFRNLFRQSLVYLSILSKCLKIFIMTADWTVFSSSFDGYFTRIFQMPHDENIISTPTLITTFRPLGQSTYNNVRKMHLNDNCQYVGTMDWQYGIASFQRIKQQKKENGREEVRKYIPKLFRSSRAYSVHDETWKASAHVSQVGSECAICQIDDHRFRLVRTYENENQMVLYRCPQPVNGYFRTTFVDSSVVVGRLCINWDAAGHPQLFISVHNSVPDFLPVLLSFSLHSLLVSPVVQRPFGHSGIPVPV